MQVWIHFMCSKVELVTHSNSNLGDWEESRVIKFLKFGSCSLLISSIAIFSEYFCIVLKGHYVSALRDGSHEERQIAIGYNFSSGSKWSLGSIASKVFKSWIYSGLYNKKCKKNLMHSCRQLLLWIGILNFWDSVPSFSLYCYMSFLCEGDHTV